MTQQTENKKNAKQIRQSNLLRQKKFQRANVLTKRIRIAQHQHKIDHRLHRLTTWTELSRGFETIDCYYTTWSEHSC